MRTNKEVLGEATGTHTDMFGVEFKVYGNSKRYFITSVGSNREALHKELVKNEIEILNLNGIFKYIELYIDSPEVLTKAANVVSKFEGCSLHKDVG